MGKISDKLKDKEPAEHPDTLEIELAGETLPFFLGRRTFDLVDDHPDEVDFVSILEGGMAAAGSENPKDRMDQIGRIIWAGMLPFEEDLDYDLIKRWLSIGDLPRLANVIQGEFKKLVEMANEVREDMGMDEVGKDPEVTETDELPDAAMAGE
jgi:hypothetical protein